MLNRKIVFTVTKSQSMKDKISFIWYHMTILWWGACGGWFGWMGGGGGNIYSVFRRAEWKWVKKPQRKWSQNLFGLGKYGGPNKFFPLLVKRSWGHILTKEAQRGTPGTPRKSGFYDWKRPKEGERVALGHFHERVGESPRSDENFGTSGSKISRFVSEIWPFEVGICVRAD